MLVAYLLGGNVKATFSLWKLLVYSIGEIFLRLLSVSMIDSLEYFQVCVRACFPIAAFGSEESNLQSNISARLGLLSLSNLHSPISICPIFMGYSGKLQGANVDLQKKMRLKYHCFTEVLHMILE